MKINSSDPSDGEERISLKIGFSVKRYRGITRGSIFGTVALRSSVSRLAFPCKLQ